MTHALADATSLWASLKPDALGLVTAVVQHTLGGQVLMVGHMNADALAATLASGRVTFWSRSRACLWQKGESSGHTLELRGMWVDCDRDALLVHAEPHGPTCHTGAPSCFFTPILGDNAVPLLDRLFAEIHARKAGRGITSTTGKSYVRNLMDGGVPAIAAKLHEEAGELAEALADDNQGHIAGEAADLLFHALVGLAHRDVELTAVLEVLARRMGRSGVDEKASRPHQQDRPGSSKPS